MIAKPKLPANPQSVLFVCKGNICRSPFAERIARHIAKNKNYHTITFYSAGLEVSGPLPPPESAVKAGARFGVKLDEHKSRNIDSGIIRSVDMICVMEPWHQKALIKSFPTLHGIENKIFLLSLFTREEGHKESYYYRYHIPDPYGRSEDRYHQCYNQIKKCVTGLLEHCQAQDGNHILRFKPKNAIGNENIQQVSSRLKDPRTISY